MFYNLSLIIEGIQATQNTKGKHPRGSVPKERQGFGSTRGMA